MTEKALARRRRTGRFPIYGSDKSGTTLGMARENLAAAGLAGAVELKQMDVLDGGPPAAGGILVMNPPYGERIGDDAELAAFYPKLGDVLKQRYTGWTAYILSADMRLPKLIGLKASKRTPLYNGALECRLFEYRLVAGSLRRPKRMPGDE
jgi:putative N6-adenine-specific DNA methylase